MKRIIPTQSTLEDGNFCVTTFILHRTPVVVFLLIHTYRNQKKMFKYFFNGYICSQILQLFSLLLRVTLSPKTTFSNSFFKCQSNLKCRTLQEQGVKRRQGTRCTLCPFPTCWQYFSQKYQPSKPKDTNCLELLRELLKAAPFFFYFFFLLKYNFIVYNLIRMLCRQVHYPS